MKKNQQPQKRFQHLSAILWALIIGFALAALFTRILMVDKLWIAAVCAGLMFLSLGGLAWHHRQVLLTKRTAFGVYSFVTALLIIGIVGVLNYFGYQYPKKWDLTSKKLHTFSQQSIDVTKGLTQEVRATFYSDIGAREEFRGLLEEFRGLSTNFKLEFVDPTRNIARARAANVRQMNTLVIEMGDRTARIETPTEEKITNELIKLSTSKHYTLCNIEGHGERSIDAGDEKGFSQFKTRVQELAYSIKKVELLKDGKIPEDCNAIIYFGATRPLLKQELSILTSYFDKGGKGLLGLDINLDGQLEASPDFVNYLKKWGVQVPLSFVIDPRSAQAFGNIALSFITTFPPDHAITKNFDKSASELAGLFMFTRPVEIAKELPKDVKVEWLAKTASSSLGITDFTGIKSGKLKLDPSHASKGPHTVAVTVKGPAGTQLVVFGNSWFGTNGLIRQGLNQDLLLNSISWLLDDFKNITIRSKEDEPGRIDASPEALQIIFLVSVLLAPVAIAGFGFFVWWRRKKL